jgi:spore maturation protein CgeB
MRILYSHNKTGYEAAQWDKEIAAASDETCTFVPFNHEPFLPVSSYLDSVALDQLYQARHPGLMKLYAELEASIHDQNIDVLLVTNAPPYHPDFLRKLPVYKVLYSTDDPDGTYRRTIPYLHAYQHVFYVAPGYSPDTDLGDKLRYCGMKNVDWLPLGFFDFEYDGNQSDETILEHERDVEIAYVGHCFRQKTPILARVKRAFGSRVKIYGYYRIKHNLYINLVHRYGGWVRSIGYRERVRLYQRTKIGFNLHWNSYGLGNQRLYLLPANGVMQLCDCPELLHNIFEPGREAVGFQNVDDLIDKMRYYLQHEDERKAIALAGFRRAVRDYRFAKVTRHAADLILRGMERIGWNVQMSSQR